MADPQQPGNAGTSPPSIDPNDIRALVNEAVGEALRSSLGPTVNAAITSHFKRGGIAELVKQAVQEQAPQQPAQGTQQPQQAQQPQGQNPEVAKLQEELRKLSEAYTASEKRAQEAHLNARKGEARREVLAALDAKGIKGTRAQGLLALMEQSGTLAFDEEGKASFTVTRERAIKGQAQPLTFDRLAQGIDDWAKAPDAADWLPAPASAKPQAPQRIGQGQAPAQGTPQGSPQGSDGKLVALGAAAARALSGV